ncbi:MAG TPA: Arm DNA-binding domain-containing protein [Bradyrhizobium sp.]|uniref:tyrosine-type recombinase/integrase n=1 Tax=Bradyrhizobium sp. TaxID=376 RepID=UPI002CAC307B|nr:Arm DNA-binding domain-containing protein [Bradyrhizobium sp.]HXB81687.1 Arm DNA-binding domain-containing protein [Bradyrhizobium sp.]
MLTDVAIRKARPGERLAKLSDGGGLQLWVTPTGGKLWYLAYRFGGRQKKLAIGAYGTAPAGVTLEAARARRNEAKALLRQGIDPAAHRRRVKAAQAESLANTFGTVADELLARKKRDGVASVTASKVEWLLGMAKASLGPLPIGSITAGEVLRVLQPLEAEGKLETARRLRSVIGAVFRLAVVTARAPNDPTQALKGAIVAPKVKSRAASPNRWRSVACCGPLMVSKASPQQRPRCNCWPCWRAGRASCAVRHGPNLIWIAPYGAFRPNA